MESQNGELLNVFIDFRKAFDRVFLHWHAEGFTTLQYTKEVGVIDTKSIQQGSKCSESRV